MQRFCLAILLLLFCIPSTSFARPLIADLSIYKIEINSSFTGTRLLLFGAKDEPGDVVVIVRGPIKNYVIREKQRIAGIWVNREQLTINSVPQFYAIASSKPLEEIRNTRLFSPFKIGQYRVFDIAAGSNERFKEAFLLNRQKNQLYNAEEGKISFMGENLFKTSLAFPDNIPPGTYTAEVYLFSDGELSSMQTTPITIEKTGFDAFVYDLAHNFPLLYGILAVLMAISAGWLASRIYEKF